MFLQVLTDVRHSVRALLARPGFVLIATLTLALGIGANVAVYSLFHQLVMRPLPVPEAEQLVNLSAPGPKWRNTSNSRIGPRDAIFSYPMFLDLQSQQQVFTGIAAHRGMPVNLSIDGQTLSGEALLVSPGYFPVLQLQPALGRLLGPQDDLPIGQAQTAVLSHRYWRNTLGGRADVLNRPIMINGVALTIVGVAPPDFTSTTLGSTPQVFVPIGARWLLAPKAMKDFDNRQSHWLYMFARLRPGISREQAAQHINRIYGQIINDIEAPMAPTNVDALAMAQFKAKQLLVEPGSSGQSSVSNASATPLLLLLAVAALVLIVACLNTANLMLARGSARAGEMAVRASIGASRGRLLREQLTEATVLALLAAMASVPLATLCLRALVSALPADAAAMIDPSVDWSTLRFALGVALVAVLMFGSFPALQAAGTAPVLSLKGGLQTGGSRIANRFRSALATAQIALSMASLVVAGLFIQSLGNLSRADLGMRVESIASFALSPDRNGYDSGKSAQLFARIEEEVAAVPGVSAVTASVVPLLSGDDWGTGVSVEGHQRSSSQEATPFYNITGTDYFRTLGIPLLAGREFTTTDAADSQKVAIVNRRFAEKYGLGQGNQVIGKRMAIGDTADLDIEIVGLVENSRYNSVKVDSQDQFFLPYRQNPDIGSLIFYVRSELPPEQLLQTLRAVAARVDSGLPVENLATFRQIIRDELVLDRFVSVLSAAFAVLATLLAAGGVYGMLSFALSQRTREIGLRLALGAAPTNIRRVLFGQVARLFAFGAAFGLLLALALGRSAQALLFEIEGHDPRVLLSAVALLALVALAAAWWPAHRASRIDPLVALRWD